MKKSTLKELRISKGLYQHDIADNFGISQSYYSLIENGLRNPSIKTAKSIASALNISLDEFYDLFKDEERSHE